MNLVLVTGPMAMGGIETLIVRLIPELRRAGHVVRLLCQDGPLASDVDDHGAVSFYIDWADAGAIVASWKDTLSEAAFVSFDPTSCALAAWLRPRLPGAAHVTGVYHPRAWFLEDDPVRLMINRMLLATLVDEQLIFMNEECRSSHAAWAKRPFARSAMLPLAVALHEPVFAPASDAFRIVSVGRLAAFKDYNLQVPEIASALKSRGIRVQWDIFGSGELEQGVQEAIASSGMQDEVHLRGYLPYREFASIGERYDVFVGMGTAALEAATLGLPTIVAACDSGERCYGFIQDLPFGNVGEVLADPPQRTIGELLAIVRSASPSDRRAIGLQSRKAASRYSMKSYAGGLVKAVRVSRSAGQFASRIASIVYRQASVGMTRQLVGKARRVLRP